MFLLSSIPHFVLVAFVVSLLGSVIVVTTRNGHLHRTSKGHAGLEIQSAHSDPTPRIGGLAVLSALIAAVLFSNYTTEFGLLLLSAVPIFVAGFAEDTGFEASPRRRLIATMFSSAIMIAVSGYTISHNVFPGVNALLSFMVVAAFLTVFVTAAVCHAFNLTDGMNGLASTIALAGSIAIAVIALKVGDMLVFTIATAIIAAVAGVFVLNFPFGKLFLGDAGAYTIGFVLSWAGVMLIARNPDINSWAVMLAVFWPAIDMVAAILRRLSKRAPLGQPDKLHFHHIVKRLWDQRLSAKTAKKWSNPLTTISMAPLIVIPPVFAVLFYDNAPMIPVCLGFSTLMYFGTKRLLVRNFKRMSTATSVPNRDHIPQLVN
ncbi:MAG: MraY family glycosyltransferase [Celeribacter marinus]